MIIWALIAVLIITIGFVSNDVLNTNNHQIYCGSTVVIVGSLVGMSDMPTTAGVIIAIGCACVAQGSAKLLSKKQKDSTD